MRRVCLSGEVRGGGWGWEWECGRQACKKAGSAGKNKEHHLTEDVQKAGACQAKAGRLRGQLKGRVVAGGMGKAKAEAGYPTGKCTTNFPCQASHQSGTGNSSQMAHKGTQAMAEMCGAGSFSPSSPSHMPAMPLSPLSLSQSLSRHGLPVRPACPPVPACLAARSSL